MRATSRGRLIIVSPAPPGTTLGNSVTADRYARIFRSLGWRVRILCEYAGEPADILVGLHARKSAPSVRAFRARYPTGPIILVLTGTDLYRDIARSRPAQRALEVADRLVTLQPDGIGHLPRHLRRKARAIVQSAEPCSPRPAQRRLPFTVCVLGHLRFEKDPLRAAYAVRDLESLPVRVVHAGKILSPQYARATRREEQRNPRYRYVGELSRARARQVLRHSDLLVQSSRIEGGANTISEAVLCGVPVVASRISGNVGMLGRTYPGFYDVGDTVGLARLIERAAASPQFYQKLVTWCARRKPLMSRSSETAGWRAVLELAAPSRVRCAKPHRLAPL